MFVVLDKRLSEKKNTKESRAMRRIKEGKTIKGRVNTKVINAKSIKSEEKIFAIKLTGIPIGNIRVPVLSPDGQPLVHTKSSRARKWLICCR